MAYSGSLTSVSTSVEAPDKTVIMGTTILPTYWTISGMFQNSSRGSAPWLKRPIISLVHVLKKFARFMIQSIVQDLCISYEPPCVSRVGYLLQEVHHKE